MREMYEKVLEGTGWVFINSSVLECPCGHRVELDGKCPNGCKSPLLKKGLI